MTENEIIKAPKPEVLYLKQLFADIDDGDIRVPAFQRRFVWNDDAIIELLESVLNGFPIGSLLFWQTDQNVFDASYSDEFPFPETNHKQINKYLLDGLQRLSTLYGCLMNKGYDTENRFNVVYDLIEHKFYHYKQQQYNETQIPLSFLFNPRKMLEKQQELLNKQTADNLISETIRIQNIFTEYMIPVVTISNRKLESVVRIFERINSTGTKLSSVDFMRALTWSSQFDLSTKVEDIESTVADKCSKINNETIAKLIAIFAGGSSEPEGMLELRNKNVNVLEHATEEAKSSLILALDFLNKSLGIMSYDFIPYEAQLLFLSKIAKLIKGHENLVEKWFWNISFNEGFKGVPDTFITKVINNADKFDEWSNMFTNKFAITDLYNKKFLSKRAMSSAYVLMLANNNAHDVMTCSSIDKNLYLREFNPYNFVGILNKDDLVPIFGDRISTNRYICNMLLIDHRHLKTYKQENIVNYLLSRYKKGTIDYLHTLETQFIDEECIYFLLKNNYQKFYERRAMLIYDKANIVMSI